MLPKVNPTTTKAWNDLKEHFDEMKGLQMRKLFEDDPSRFSKFSIQDEGLFFDYSRNLVTEKTISLLLSLAKESGLDESIKAMFNGELINETESRPVLHTALRNKTSHPVYAKGNDVMPGVHAELKKIKDLCDEVHAGKYRGYTGKRIRYIVNIGIGGSDLGPRMVTEALRPYWEKNIRPYFVANIDAADLSRVLSEINPEKTLFLIASKTFTTQETMTNAHTARQWFLKRAKNKKHIARHFIAMSTNIAEVEKFGIPRKNMFTFWDWVGGRFSLWSAAGLAIPLTIGYENFEELLKGAFHADNHFIQSEPGKNIPVIMSLLTTWYTNFFNCQTKAILPYCQDLQFLPAYLQQAVMESNGKMADRNGEQVDYSTGPVIWGEPGTNGQHAFFQLLHQGTQLVPSDFIGCAQSRYETGDHHQKLMSNFFAQSEALMKGKTEMEVQKELREQGLTTEEIAAILPYKIFPGNKPSNCFLLKELSPRTLGQLVAYYEHMIFCSGIMWNIYSFDQWGVELGKQLAGNILSRMKEKATSATGSLLGIYQSMRENDN